MKEVDVEEDDTGWGHALRVRVEINLTKPLARGMSIIVQGENIWIPIQYEKLTHFYFNYGRIIHVSICKPSTELSGQKQIGVWLRADMQRRG